MPKRLLLLEDSRRPREFLPHGTKVTVGRSPGGAIVLRHPSVSREHAILREVDDRLLVEDLGSSQGTFVNDEQIQAGEQRLLEDGDELRFGRSRVLCRFDFEGVDREVAVEDARFASQANARVLVVEAGTVARIPFAGAITAIGSSPHCQIQLQDAGAPTEQAVIRASKGRFEICARNPAHPIRLNDVAEVVRSAVELESESVVLTNKSQILFLYDFEPDGREILDPLEALSVRVRLRELARRSRLPFATLKSSHGESVSLGRRLGEVLVESQLVTPVLWHSLRNSVLADTKPSRWPFF